MAEMTQEQFLGLQGEVECLERAVAMGEDSPTVNARLKELEGILSQCPWVLHPDYGCITKREVALIDALEVVRSQLQQHPEVSLGSSKVHYCYHKADGVLKDLAEIGVVAAG